MPFTIIQCPIAGLYEIQPKLDVPYIFSEKDTKYPAFAIK